MFRLAGASFFGFAFLYILVAGGLGSILWPYVLNTWLVFFDKTAVVTDLNGFLIGLIPGFGQTCIGLSLVTWILMLFLVP